MIKKILLLLFGALVLTLSVAALLLFWPLPEPPNAGVAGDFLIEDVRVVDVGTGTVSSPQRVRIENGVITALGRDVPADQSLRVVDGSGQFLMPGLWDMHTHSLKTSPQWLHPLWIANGVTGVREMSGCMSEPDSFWACNSDRRRWNDETAAHERLAPRYVLQSGHAINGGSEVPDDYPAFFRAETEDQILELIRFYAEDQTDFLKIYTDLSPTAYAQLADEARRQGMAFAGHRPIRVSLLDTLAAGQASIEHPRVFLFECAESAEAFRQHDRPYAHYDVEYRSRLVDAHDQEKCAELMAEFARSDTWWTPTLQVLRMSALAHDETFRNDDRLKYIPYPLRKLAWESDADGNAAKQSDAAGRNVYQLMYEMAQDHVVQAHRAGVKLLLGTDAGDTYVFPGFSVHDEMREMVEAGLSPAEVLKIATLDAARFAAKDDRFGSVEVGKAGDLILLGSNPLQDIGNTRDIQGVFYHGRYLDRSDLDDLLAFVEDQGNGLRMSAQTVRKLMSSPLMRKQLAD